MLPSFNHALAWATYEYTRDPAARTAAARAINAAGWPVVECDIVRAHRHASGTVRSLAATTQAAVNGHGGI